MGETYFQPPFKPALLLAFVTSKMALRIGSLPSVFSKVPAIYQSPLPEVDRAYTMQMLEVDQFLQLFQV